MTVRAGFVGLGNIGMPMARRLLDAGIPTLVCDLVPERVQALVDHGARAATSPAAMAREVDVVGICVRDDADVRAVLGGDAGLLAAASPGVVVALHGTVGLETVLAMGEAARARGVGMLDACVTGGAAGAAAGTLTTMVGGAAADVERARPLLEAFSRAVVPTGPLGSGTVVKLCNNLMGYLAWTAAFEATQLARAAGVSVDVLEAVTRSGGHLTENMAAFMRMHRTPEAVRRGPEMQARLRAFVEIAEKDLAAALDLARAHGIALPGTGVASQIMARVYGLDDPGRR